MNYEIQITRRAKDDMRDIYSYIAYHLLEPAIAIKQYSRIKSSILNLEQMPERYSLYPDEPWHSKGLRKFAVDNYIIFYVVDVASSAVVIIRVLYGGRDLNAHLGEGTN